MLTSLRHHATTITICATFAVLTIAGSATAARLITGADIKNNTVSSVDIKDRTIQVGDFSLDAGRALQGPEGPTGDRGPQGPRGEPGPAGTGGSGALTGLQRVTASFPSSAIPGFVNHQASGAVDCPAGRYAIADGHAFTAQETVAQPITLVGLAPTGATLPTGVQGSATSGRSFTLTLDVVCANIPA